MSAEQTQENTATDVVDDALQEEADGSGMTGVTDAPVASETTASATSTDSSSKADAESEGGGSSSVESSYTSARAVANDESNELAGAGTDTPKRQQQSIVTPQKTTSTISPHNIGGSYSRGVGSAIRNPTMKITPAGGTSTLGRRQSWADAAREDDMMGRNPYVNFMDASDLGDLEDQDDLMDRLLYNNRNAEGTSATGATEEERKARKERIRARQEERLLHDSSAGDGSASTPRYYHGADGSFKKLPNFSREEHLESMKEGGVPIKSWLAIFAVVGVGLYKIYQTVKGPAAGQKRQKNTAAALSPLKKRSGSKLKGKKGSGGKRINSTSTQSPPPDLKVVDDFDLEEPEPKLEPKQPKKKTAAARKKRPKKYKLATKRKETAEPLPNVASPDIDEGNEGEKGSAGASSTVPAAATATDTATDTATATATATATNTATTDSPTGTTTVTTVPSSNVVVPTKSTPASSDLHHLNEDDRLAIMQVLAENREDGNSDDGEWQTAGRKSKPVSKPKEQRKILATSTTNPHPNVDRSKEEQIHVASSVGNTDTNNECSATTNAGIDDPESTAKDNSKEEKSHAGGEKKNGTTNAATPQSNAEESNATDAESATDKNDEGSAAQRRKTKEEDAALALKLQQQEDSMAAREKGETADEMWEEVPKKKNWKKKAAATALTPSTAIAAS